MKKPAVDFSKAGDGWIEYSGAKSKTALGFLLSGLKLLR
jgi:hypothetical protein